MYAAAQRVVAPRRLGGHEGVNIFIREHGLDYPWPDDPWNLPEDDPGDSVVEDPDVPPGGNRVRSYLDVLFPDDCSWEEAMAAVTALWLELIAADAAVPYAEPIPNPAVFVRGDVTVRFGTDAILQANRPLELSELRMELDTLWRVHAE